MFNLSDISVVILAGGSGKRLRSVVSKLPKVLAEVSNRPFLEIILDQLNSSGFQNVVVCTGYLGKHVEDTFGKKYKGLNLSYSQERVPLGTGGALRLALPLIKSETVLVINGDSFYDISFDNFLNFHINKNANVSLAILHVLETDRFGRVHLGLNDEILGFEEKKKKSGPGFISAGIYLLKHSLISEIPEGTNISLEKEIFPKWVNRNFYGYKSQGRFIDIGTPQSYAQVEHFFTKGVKKGKRFVLLDRDGTIIAERNYLSDPQDVELLPGAAKALKQLKEMGLELLVITNQSGLGRGHFNLNTLEQIHQRMVDLLAKEGIVLGDIYFCPHVPEDKCRCRKPNIGLIEKAIKDHNFDPKESFVIGDNAIDIELGKNIGAITILVKTGYGKEIAEKHLATPDYVTDNLNSSVEIINKLIKA